MPNLKRTRPEESNAGSKLVQLVPWYFKEITIARHTNILTHIPSHVFGVEEMGVLIVVEQFLSYTQKVSRLLFYQTDLH